MKDAVEREIGVLDESGTVVACSELSRVGGICSGAMDLLAAGGECARQEGYSYRGIGGGAHPEFAVFVQGEDEIARSLCNVLSVTLGNVKGMYDEKNDRNSLLRNIILDNILPNEVYIKSKDLRFMNEGERAVFLFNFSKKDDPVPFDMILALFPDRNGESLISISEYEVVLVKEVTPGTEARDLEQFGQAMADTMETEFYTRVTVGIGSAVSSIKNLSSSYREAQVALEVGKIFDNEKNVVSYENMGIGRLIYQLPDTLCEMFLAEVFKRGSIEGLDRETLSTIQCFFDNNLNVSETSRKLFVHRNTLVYRLDKIRKLTGLDLREFEHAITFKVAMMVKKYLASKKSEE